MNTSHPIIVTGVAGFIGARIAERFLNDGYDVIGVDDFTVGRPENVPKGVSFIEGDLIDVGTLKKLPRRCDVLLHLAGQSSGEISFDDPVTDLKKNAISTLNLIRYGLDVGVRKFVYASSMSVYGNQPDAPVREDALCLPLSCYGNGKLAAERYLMIYGHDLPFIAFRMFNVYGTGQDLSNLRQGMVSIFLAQALMSGKVQVKGSAARFRDFIHVDDVVEAWVRAAFDPDPESAILNLGTGVRSTVSDLLSEIQSHIPGMEWFCEGTTPGDQNGIYAETSALWRRLGLTRMKGLKEGLPEFIDWAKGRISPKCGRKQGALLAGNKPARPSGQGP